MNSWPQWRRRLAGVSAVMLPILLWQGAVRTPTESASGEGLNAPGGTLKEGVGAISPSRDGVLRVATFNIDGGMGVDGKVNLVRTADVVGKAPSRRDIVGFEEVHGSFLLGGPDQAAILGAHLHMPWLFGPTERRWWHDSFGNGIVCDLPVIGWRRERLSMTLQASNRTLLTCVVKWEGRPVTVLVTHLDRGEDHDMELGAVLAAFRDAPTPAILLGDLNTHGDHSLLVGLRHEGDVTDCVGAAAAVDDVDWIFARGMKSIASGFVQNDASDHPMAWADLTLAAVR